MRRLGKLVDGNLCLPRSGPNHSGQLGSHHAEIKDILGKGQLPANQDYDALREEERRVQLAATAAGDGRPLGTGKLAVFPERVVGLKRNIGAILSQKSSEILWLLRIPQLGLVFSWSIILLNPS
ncbi:hypothetical protein QTP88_014873 [Uroleucon formosanum]